MKELLPLGQECELEAQDFSITNQIEEEESNARPNFIDKTITENEKKPSVFLVDQDSTPRNEILDLLKFEKSSNQTIEILKKKGEYNTNRVFESMLEFCWLNISKSKAETWRQFNVGLDSYEQTQEAQEEGTFGDNHLKKLPKPSESASMSLDQLIEGFKAYWMQDNLSFLDCLNLLSYALLMLKMSRFWSEIRDFMRSESSQNGLKTILNTLSKTPSDNKTEEISPLKPTQLVLEALIELVHDLLSTVYNPNNLSRFIFSTFKEPILHLSGTHSWHSLSKFTQFIQVITILQMSLIFFDVSTMSQEEAKVAVEEYDKARLKFYDEEDDKVQSKDQEPWMEDALDNAEEEEIQPNPLPWITDVGENDELRAGMEDKGGQEASLGSGEGSERKLLREPKIYFNVSQEYHHFNMRLILRILNTDFGFDYQHDLDEIMARIREGQSYNHTLGSSLETNSAESAFESLQKSSEAKNGENEEKERDLGSEDSASRHDSGSQIDFSSESDHDQQDSASLLNFELTNQDNLYDNISDLMSTFLLIYPLKSGFKLKKIFPCVNFNNKKIWVNQFVQGKGLSMRKFLDFILEYLVNEQTSMDVSNQMHLKMADKYIKVFKAGNPRIKVFLKKLKFLNFVKLSPEQKIELILKEDDKTLHSISMKYFLNEEMLLKMVEGDIKFSKSKTKILCINDHFMNLFFSRPHIEGKVPYKEAVRSEVWTRRSFICRRIIEVLVGRLKDKAYDLKEVLRVVPCFKKILLGTLNNFYDFSSPLKSIKLDKLRMRDFDPYPAHLDVQIITIGFEQAQKAGRAYEYRMGPNDPEIRRSASFFVRSGNQIFTKWVQRMSRAQISQLTNEPPASRQQLRNGNNAGNNNQNNQNRNNERFNVSRNVVFHFNAVGSNKLYYTIEHDVHCHQIRYESLRNGAILLKKLDQRFNLVANFPNPQLKPSKYAHIITKPLNGASRQRLKLHYFTEVNKVQQSFDYGSYYKSIYSRKLKKVLLRCKGPWMKSKLVPNSEASLTLEKAHIKRKLNLDDIEACGELFEDVVGFENSFVKKDFACDYIDYQNRVYYGLKKCKIYTFCYNYSRRELVLVRHKNYVDRSGGLGYLFKISSNEIKFFSNSQLLCTRYLRKDGSEQPKGGSKKASTQSEAQKEHSLSRDSKGDQKRFKDSKTQKIDGFTFIQSKIYSIIGNKVIASPLKLADFALNNSVNQVRDSELGLRLWHRVKKISATSRGSGRLIPKFFKVDITGRMTQLDPYFGVSRAWKKITFAPYLYFSKVDGPESSKIYRIELNKGCKIAFDSEQRKVFVLDFLPERLVLTVLTFYDILRIIKDQPGAASEQN